MWSKLQEVHSTCEWGLWAVLVCNWLITQGSVPWKGMAAFWGFTPVCMLTYLFLIFLNFSTLHWLHKFIHCVVFSSDFEKANDKRYPPLPQHASVAHSENSTGHRKVSCSLLDMWEGCLGYLWLVVFLTSL